MDSPINSVPWKRKCYSTRSPKLNENSRKTFIHHLHGYFKACILNEIKTDMHKHLRRVLLINYEFMNLFLNDPKYGTALYTNHYNLILCFKSDNNSYGMDLSPQISEAILKMAKIHSIELFITWSYMNNWTQHNDIPKWIKICLLLKHDKNLEKIFVNTGALKDIHSRIFFDLLTNKINKVKIDTCFDRLHIFFGQQYQFESVSLGHRLPSIGQVMSIKTKRLGLAKDADVLMAFSRCGKLKPNPHIESIKMGALFGHFNKSYDTEKVRSMDQHKYVNEILPIYSKSIECLRNFNPNMKLNFILCVDVHTVNRQESLNSTINQLRLQIENIKKFIDMVKEHEMILGSISVEDEIFVKPDHWSEDFAEKVSNKLQLNLTNDGTSNYEPYIRDSITYNGIQINFRLNFLIDIQNDDEYDAEYPEFDAESAEMFFEQAQQYPEFSDAESD